PPEVVLAALKARLRQEVRAAPRVQAAALPRAQRRPVAPQPAAARAAGEITPATTITEARPSGFTSCSSLPSLVFPRPASRHGGIAVAYHGSAASRRRAERFSHE